MAGSGTAHMRPFDESVLRIDNLSVDFTFKGFKVQAVTNVSLDVIEGETLGLVGESGCGKSTTGRAIMQLVRPTGGRVVLEGENLMRLRGNDLRKVRARLQMIFQDPISSLNPRRKVADIVGEGLTIWGMGTPEERRALVEETLATVGLDPDQVRDKRPHQLSGGQCQRVSIARSVILSPKVLICDEPVSALDVSVQAAILDLLERMKERYRLTMIFIAHDLAVVKNISDRVAVMYLGKLCEVGPPDEIYHRPAHPYTQALLEAVPVPNPEVRPSRTHLGGEPPSPLAPPSGCRFRTRCPLAQDKCAEVEPEMEEVAPGHYVACHFPLRAPGYASGAASAQT